MFRVIVACGQDFQDYPRLQRTMDRLLANVHEEIMIVSGQQCGLSSPAEQYAKERRHSVRVVPSLHDKYGPAADYVRNLEMVDCADALIAFWDSQNECVKHMIEMAQNKKLNIRVIFLRRRTNIVTAQGGTDTYKKIFV